LGIDPILNPSCDDVALRENRGRPHPRTARPHALSPGSTPIATAMRRKGENQMDQKLMLKQMVEFNQTTFDNSFKALAMVQNHMENMTNAFIEKADWMPQESRKALETWMTACKKGSDNFKKYVDESFKKADAYWVG
jgi:hypothetical protein